MEPEAALTRALYQPINSDLLAIHKGRGRGVGVDGWCNDQQLYEDDNQHQEPANAQLTLC